MNPPYEHVWGVSKAADRIGALVCGYGKNAWERQVMVWRAYIDDSRDDEDEGLFVLAGYIAQAHEWAEFSKEWEEMLPFLPKYMDSFKMSTLMMSEEGKEKALAFYRIVEKYEFWGLSCSYKKSDLINAIDGIQWPDMENLEKFKRDLKNPYFFGFKAIINVLCQEQGQMGISEPVNFVFDEQNEKKRVLEAWDLLKESTPEAERKLMGVMPVYEDEKIVMPLQAADLFAWLVRDWETKQIDWMEEGRPFPWSTDTKPIKGLNMRFVEKDFHHELCDKFQVVEPQGILTSFWGQSSS